MTTFADVTTTPCADNPDLFHQPEGFGSRLWTPEPAKALCRTCRVRSACLTWAIDTGQKDGVWGGLTYEERRKLPKREGATK